MMAKSMGVEGRRCTTVGEFAAAFKEAMEKKGPFLVQCVVRGLNNIGLADPAPKL